MGQHKCWDTKHVYLIKQYYTTFSLTTKKEHFTKTYRNREKVLCQCDIETVS